MMKNKKPFFLNDFSNIILQHFLINKYTYENLCVLPCIKKIVCNFRLDEMKLYSLAVFSLVFDSVFKQKAKITRASKACVILKMRQGNVSGCVITVRKSLIFQALEKEKFSPLKEFFLNNVISHGFQNTFENSGLQNYQHFNETKNINVAVIANKTKKQELIFILKALQQFVNV